MNDGAEFTPRPRPARSIFSLHKTGETPSDALKRAKLLCPEAAIYAPTGTREEAGRLRFFARKADRSFDIADWRRAGAELSYQLTTRWQINGWPHPVLVGLSHGANAALSILRTSPQLAHAAVLFRPAPLPDDFGEPVTQPVLVVSGSRDAIVNAHDTQKLLEQLKSAGAQTTHLQVDSDHAMTEQELDLARRWLEEN